MSFLTEYAEIELPELKQLARENRPDLKALTHRADAIDEGEKMAIGKFLPTLSVSYGITKQAQDSVDFSFGDITGSSLDYIRAKALTFSLNWPLFQGGKRLLDYQKARLQTKQVEIALNQGKDQAEIDVERSYYGYQEAVKNLNALQEAMLQSKESLRLANLLFSEGMSVQKDVLDAQLLYTQSTIQYLQGIYNYNISQLSLLNSIGLIKKIWE
ncbi:MAG TPA: TolC family protein [Ignavibacteriales bacterium]|nr:TolC family protein [Ignavibacteriales bacterium]